MQPLLCNANSFASKLKSLQSLDLASTYFYIIKTCKTIPPMYKLVSKPKNPDFHIRICTCSFSLVEVFPDSEATGFASSGVLCNQIIEVNYESLS